MSFAFVLILDVQPLAVENAEVVVQDTVSVALEKSSEQLRAHVAASGRKPA